MQNNLLLLSSSRTHGTGYLEHAREWLVDCLKGVSNILFIPYAGVTISGDDYTAQVAESFRAINITVDGIHMALEPRHAVEQAEAIAVGGGNTFQLLNNLYQHDLLAAIQARVKVGMPYIGWSAGSNVACPTIRTSNDMPIVEPPSFAALDLIPFQINPHYIKGMPEGHMGESRDQRLQEFLAANPDSNVLGLPEGSALRCKPGSVQLLGKPAMLFQADGAQAASEALVADLWL